VISRLIDLLVWLASRDARFWTVAWSLFGLHVLTFFLPVRETGRWRRWLQPAAFAGTLLLLFLGFRWPGIAQNEELQNPDESQLIASALTMAATGHYWGRVDGATTGPLAPLPLVLPRLLGWPLDYVAAHLVQVLLLVGTVLCVWRIFARYFGERAAPWLALPLTCAMAFTHFWDFVQYSSEQAPVLLTAMALWLLCTAFDPAAASVASPRRLAAAGFLIGLLPFSKLQVTPFAVVIGLTGLVWIASNGAAARARLRAAGLFTGGAVAALLLVLLTIVAHGGWDDFVAGYLRTNLWYTTARTNPWRDFPAVLHYLVNDSWGFPYFYYPCSLLVALGLAGWPALPQERRRVLAFTGALFCIAFVAVIAPGRSSQHYLQLLWVPVTLHAGMLIGALAGAAGDPARRAWRWRPVLLWVSWLGLGVAPQIYYRTHDWNPYLQSFCEERGRMPANPVADLVRAWARPGDTMAVWGWAPKYYVLTQLPHATSESNAERQISPGPRRPFFRARFLREVGARAPAIFLDAVGPGNFGYKERSVDGHEVFPELRALVAERYVLAGDREGTRVYVRRDRWRP
jgi:hypothetical protein